MAYSRDESAQRGKENKAMATVVYGKEGDDFIITRIDFGHGDEYLVECRVGAGYHTVYSSFDYGKALAKLKAQTPSF